MTPSTRPLYPGMANRSARLSTCFRRFNARGITNLFVKLLGEVPVLDGSALELCQVIEEAGLVSQRVARKELVIDRKYEVVQGEESLTIEPYDGFRISYLLRYPPPVGEQHYEFELSSFEAYKQDIAPARTFGFMRDVKMMAEARPGLGCTPRQLHLGGRGQRSQHRATLRRRIRAA